MPALPPPRALLLDLDGTLVDTHGFLFDAFRHAVEPFVSKVPTDEEVVATFGPAEPECIARYLRRAEAEGFAKVTAAESAAKAAKRFFTFYEEGHDQVRAFPGMLDLIRDATAAGKPVGVFTGKSRRGAEYTLTQLGLWPTGAVKVLVSSDDVVCSKPHPEGVEQALEQLGMAKEELLFVGDAPADIQSGQAAGVATAAALWGCFDKEATLRLKPTYALAKVEELRAVVMG